MPIMILMPWKVDGVQLPPQIVNTYNGEYYNGASRKMLRQSLAPYNAAGEPIEKFGVSIVMPAEAYEAFVNANIELFFQFCKSLTPEQLDQIPADSRPDFSTAQLVFVDPATGVVTTVAETET